MGDNLPDALLTQARKCVPNMSGAFDDGLILPYFARGEIVYMDALLPFAGGPLGLSVVICPSQPCSLISQKSLPIFCTR